MTKNKLLTTLLLLLVLVLTPLQIASAADSPIVVTQTDLQVIQNKELGEEIHNIGLYYYGWDFGVTFGVPPENVMYAHENGDFSVAMDNGTTVEVLRLNAAHKVIKKLTLKKPFGIFAGFTSDPNGNYYILYGKVNRLETDKAANLQLVGYTPDGKVKATAFFGGFEEDVKIPLNAATSRIVYGHGEVAVTMGVQMYKSNDGLNHQKSFNARFDAGTLKRLDPQTFGEWCSHSFDQRIINDDFSFVTVELGDGNPKGIAINKLDGNGDDIRTVFTYKSQYVDHYAKDIPPNALIKDNPTYTFLGGILRDDAGYVVTGSSEKSVNFKTPHLDSRNIFLILVNKDFGLMKSDQPRNVVSPNIVISKGETSPVFRWYKDAMDDEKQQNTGVVWLTDYKNAESDNACTPKLVALTQGRYAVLWENQTRMQRFKETFLQVVDAWGNKIGPAMSLGQVRLPRGDDLISINNKILWTLTEYKDKTVKRTLVSFTVNPKGNATAPKPKAGTTVSGEILLPNGMKAEKDLIFFIDAWSKNSTTSSDDDLRVTAKATMKKGDSKVTFSIALPPSKSGYALGYDLSNAYGTAFMKRGYLSSYGMGAPGFYQSVETLKEATLQLSAVKKFTLTGKLSLPTGLKAPKSGIHYSIYALNRFFEEAYYSEDYANYTFGNMLQNATSVPFKMVLPDTGSAYKLLYSASSEQSLGISTSGYYMPPNSTIDVNQATFLGPSDEGKSLLFQIAKGNVLSGKVTLPEAIPIKDSKEPLFISVSARWDNNTPNEFEDDEYFFTEVILNNGQRSGDYILNLPEKVKNAYVSYSMNKYTQLDARCEGFYSTSGMVQSLQEATRVDVSKAPVNMTILPGKLAMVVSGKITLPEGLVVPEKGLGIRLQFLGYRTVYTGTRDTLYEIIEVPFAKGERSKSYSIVLPNIDGYYHMDLGPSYGSEAFIPIASYDGKGFSPSVIDRYPLKTGANLTLNFTAPKVTKTALVEMGEIIKNAPKVSVKGTLSLPKGDVVSGNGLMVRVTVYGVKWSAALNSNYEQFFTSDVLMPAGSKSIDYDIKVANNMDWYILAYEMIDAGAPYKPFAYRLSDTALTNDLDSAQRIDIKQQTKYNILISR